MGMNIDEQVFHNKGLCDAIRELMLESTLNYDDALLLLSKSDNHRRDLFTIKKLANGGICLKQLVQTIALINK